MAFIFHIIISVTHWIPTILGYNLLFGKGKVLHFGPIGVSCAVAYATFLTLAATGSYPIAILAGAATAVIFSSLLAMLSVRLPADAFGVMTIAIHLVVLNVILNWTNVTRGALGIPGIPRPFGIESIALYALFTSIIAVAAFIFFLRLERGALGRKIAALAEHEWHGVSLGIDRMRVHTAAFILLGFCHVLGVLMAVPYYHLLHTSDYQFSALIFLVMIVIAGKPGNVLGVISAAIVLTILKEGLRFLALPADILGPMRLMLFGVILFAAVWWRKDVLFPQQRSV